MKGVYGGVGARGAHGILVVCAAWAQVVQQADGALRWKRARSGSIFLS